MDKRLAAGVAAVYLEIGRRWREIDLRGDLRHTWALLRGRTPA